jgi:hypothetical protein
MSLNVEDARFVIRPDETDRSLARWAIELAATPKDGGREAAPLPAFAPAGR